MRRGLHGAFSTPSPSSRRSRPVRLWVPLLLVVPCDLFFLLTTSSSFFFFPPRFHGGFEVQHGWPGFPPVRLRPLADPAGGSLRQRQPTLPGGGRDPQTQRAEGRHPRPGQLPRQTLIKLSRWTLGGGVEGEGKLIKLACAKG